MTPNEREYKLREYFGFAAYANPPIEFSYYAEKPPVKGMRLVGEGWVFWDVDSQRHRPHHDAVLRDYFEGDEVLLKVTQRTPDDLQIANLTSQGLCSDDIREVLARCLYINDETELFIYDVDGQEWQVDVREWKRLCGA